MLLVSWIKFDAVEDAATDVSGALERIAARPRDDQRLLSRLQPAGQPLVSIIAEQTAADRRHRDVRDIEVDEGVFRIAFFRPRRGTGVAGFFEGLVHVSNGKDQLANGTVTDQALPIPDFAFSRFDRL